MARKGKLALGVALIATSRGPACANDVYEGGSPFDRDFYLIINVAVGGSGAGAVPYWGSEVFRATLGRAGRHETAFSGRP